MKKLVILLLLLFVSFFFTASNFSKSTIPASQQELAKIDPALHPILESKSPADLVQSELDLSKVWIDSVTLNNEYDGRTTLSVLVHTDNPDALVQAGMNVNSRLHGFVTARLTADELIEAARLADVSYISTGQVYYPKNDVAAGETGAMLLNNGYVNNTSFKGSGVLVCIIDTGIDWAHLDFRDPVDDTQSRILYIWDQTLTKTGGEVTPEDRDGTNFAGLNYGVEYSQSDIEDEIDGSPAGFVREADTHGHGTHVAGSAVGNGAANSSLSFAGMAPEADILVVKAGNGSFADDDVINGMTWAQKMSETLGKPVVVNMSLGGHGSAHDGTGLQEVAIDDFADQGRVAVVAAGNEGSDDIHFSGTVPGSSTQDVTFTIPAYTPAAGTGNDVFGIVIWYDDASDISMTIDPPTISSFTYNAGTSGYYGDDTDGYVYGYNGVDPDYTNGDRKTRMFVYDAVEANTPAAGTWTVTLTNNTGSAVDFHGWLYTQSMDVNITGANSNYTVGDPGTANEALTVAAYTARWRWSNSTGSGYSYGGTETSDDIAGFSSIGPRRDNVQKPDIAAPGMGVISAKSQDISPDAAYIAPGTEHYLTQGTSMASPVTAGTVALMLEADPNLTAAQIKTLITDNSYTDSFTGGSLPDYNWGYGKLDAFKVVSKILDSGSNMDREILAYDGWSSDASSGLGPNVYDAVRFTPTITGQAAGVFYHPSTTIDMTSPLYFEVWSDNGGLPNAKLGSSVTVNQSAILPYTWNYLDLTGTGVNVTSGTSYHVVFYFTSGTSFFIRQDDGSVDNRSSQNTGGGWAAVGTHDFRIRPVVVTGQDALLALKVFLEGPYDPIGDAMSTTLKTNGDIPTTSPYTEDARSVSSVPNDITDWVLVQLRSTPGGAAVESHSAFLRNDGRIVADNGTTTDLPMDAAAGDYYIVVKHRNHLAVMSDNPHTLSTGSSSLYDFTSALTQYEGGDAALLETGVYGLYSGNADGSIAIDANDRADTWNDRNITGYQDSDCTLTGTVDANDRTATWNNRNVSTNVP